VRNNGTLLVKTSDGTLLPVGSGYSAQDGKMVHYGFRPEHLSLCAPTRGIAALVGVVEPMGSETQVHLTIGGEPAVAVFRERISARPGGTLSIEPDVAKLTLFDAETGQVLERCL
jgi:multiple sugar transport system ATP-binding protein